MTTKQLKQYLSENRNHEEQFSEALSELLNRDPNPVIYPADMPLEEMERIIKAKIEQIQASD
jgi:pyrroloquinoline quinone (PQQ) biosynthesis protein C